MSDVEVTDGEERRMNFSSTMVVVSKVKST